MAQGGGDPIIALLKRNRLVSIYLGIGLVFAYRQANSATQTYATGSGTEVWGGFSFLGKTPSRMSSIIQNALFWPYALLSGNPAANNPNDGTPTMLGAGQSWSGGLADAGQTS